MGGAGRDNRPPVILNGPSGATRREQRHQDGRGHQNQAR